MKKCISVLMVLVFTITLASNAGANTEKYIDVVQKSYEAGEPIEEILDNVETGEKVIAEFTLKERSLVNIASGIEPGKYPDSESGVYNGELQKKVNGTWSCIYNITGITVVDGESGEVEFYSTGGYYYLKKGQYRFVITPNYPSVSIYADIQEYPLTNTSKKKALNITGEQYKEASLMIAPTDKKKVQFYKIKVKKPQKLLFEFAANVDSGKVKVELYNKKGKRIGKKIFKKNINEKTKRIIKKVKKGTYYIKVSKMKANTQSRIRLCVGKADS